VCVLFFIGHWIKATCFLFIFLIVSLLCGIHWLIVGSGSSYATSAVALGFGPRGAMERFDMIGQNGVRSWYRLDWHEQCRQVRPKVCPIP
jgi:hypothetical protein